jgi:signal transduction histidine kinase
VGRPLRRLEDVARRIAGGDMRARARLEGSREQRSLARSFNEMTERIARLLRLQRDFVADASHQLRTPLTGLRLRLEEARAVGQPPAVEQIDAAIAEVDRLSHTVEELLVLSRGGERQGMASGLDLDLVVQAALDRWDAGAQSRGIRLERTPRRDPAPGWASRPDIDRALDALIENALNYSSRGARVEVGSAPGVIEVSDRGPGIAPDEQEAVFERFHRGGAGRAGPAGSGLGLSIARELAREWGGEVELSARAGGGTTARLTLRVEAADPSLQLEDALPALNRPAASVS